jgi:hypothetical protein
MTRIGPVRYSKDEEKNFFVSFFLALPLGLPTGILFIFLSGFPLSIGHIPSDFVNRFVVFFLWLGRLEVVWFLITVVFVTLLYKKDGLFSSWNVVAKVLWALFVFFPLIVVYVSFILSAVIFPVYFATPWLDFVGHYCVSNLLVLPFLALFDAILLPETNARRAVRSVWFTREMRTSPLKLKKDSAILTILVSLWLLLAFSPLPNIVSVKLPLGVSGILIVAYLARYRRKMRRGKRNNARLSKLVTMNNSGTL